MPLTDATPLVPAGKLERALEKLISLHEGDRGVLEVVACAARAIPRLRTLLFRREPSGLF